LNHDYYTDIITFDYSENDVVSGDLFISFDRVKDNANTYGISFENELKRVVYHGILHLCGYKDKTEKDVIEMREKENYYLSQFVSRETNGGFS
jgi:rRNA maturation RNase YbeY